jgi:hypothetical protein
MTWTILLAAGNAPPSAKYRDRWRYFVAAPRQTCYNAIE